MLEIVIPKITRLQEVNKYTLQFKIMKMIPLTITLKHKTF